MRRVRLYLLFHNGVFRDVFASYSDASVHLTMSEAGTEHSSKCCKIEQRDRYDY